MMLPTVLKRQGAVASAGNHRFSAKPVVFAEADGCGMLAGGSGCVVFCQHATWSFSVKAGVWRNGSARHDEISDDPREEFLTRVGCDLSFPCQCLARRNDREQAMESDG